MPALFRRLQQTLTISEASLTIRFNQTDNLERVVDTWLWSSRYCLPAPAWGWCSLGYHAWLSGARQNRSLVLVSSTSRCESPTVCPASEAEDIPDSPKSEETEPTSLRTLPTELILLISELPLPAGALCLALICRRMYKIVDISYLAPRPDTDAVDTLLCRLVERDITRFTYCYTYQKLRPAQSSPHRPIRYFVHYHDTASLERVLFVRVNLFLLDYCATRTVMNHQLLGLQHGVPASCLANVRKYQHPYMKGICGSEVWAAHVIP